MPKGNVMHTLKNTWRKMLLVRALFQVDRSLQEPGMVRRRSPTKPKGSKR